MWDSQIRKMTDERLFQERNARLTCMRGGTVLPLPKNIAEYEALQGGEYSNCYWIASKSGDVELLYRLANEFDARGWKRSAELCRVAARRREVAK